MTEELTKSTMPNFLVIGAAKSGTTSVYQYLKQHPDIFMSPVKEPLFFTYKIKNFLPNGPGVREWMIKTKQERIEDLESYQKLFEGHTTEKAIGEATSTYILFKECAAAIHEHIPNAKLIVVFRNPVDRAFSHYVWAVREGLEKLSNFSDALAAEESRIKENWGIQWRYKSLGFYYDQLKPYYEIFAPEQIKVCLYDNLLANPHLFMQDIYGFLEVERNFSPDTSTKYNPSLIPRNQTWHNFLNQPNLIKSIIKPIFPKRFRKNLKYKAKSKNIYKPSLETKIEQKLQEEYKKDILKIQKLTKQDFSVWLSQTTK